MIALIVHGGAGNWKRENESKAYEILRESADIGISILKKNGSSLDAVEKTINSLEDSGFFNAGVGSIAQNDGKVRMDSSIMNGPTLRCGAVGAIEYIRNPISVARIIMEQTDHVLLVGENATKFALKNGFKKINFVKGKDNTQTVGAIALDKIGRISAGSSTGGRKLSMLPGRVGDSAIIGAGIYANKFAGVVTSGLGEFFIRTNLAARACNLVKNLNSQKVANKCIRILKEIGGKGGIVVLNKKGDYGVSYNTKTMPFAYRVVK